MQIETLKLYCDVVRLRSVSRGGALSGVTQSAASQAIQQLETDLDIQLLDRSRRPLQPTPEGRGFYEACRTLLAELRPGPGGARLLAAARRGQRPRSRDLLGRTPRHEPPHAAVHGDVPQRARPAGVPPPSQGGRGRAGGRGRPRDPLVPPGEPGARGAPAPRGAHGARLPPEPPAGAPPPGPARPTSRASGSSPSTTTCRSGAPSTASSARRASASRWSCSSTTSRRSSRRSPSPPASVSCPDRRWPRRSGSGCSAPCRSGSAAWSVPIAIIHRKRKRLPPAVDRFIDLLRKAGDSEALGGRAEGARP